MTVRERSTVSVVEAAKFLNSLSQLTSAASLYPKNHPARGEALDRCWEILNRAAGRIDPRSRPTG